jgi:hypothetical protein
MKRIIEFADVPGAVLLALFAIFQIIFVTPSHLQVQFGHSLDLEQAVIELCSEDQSIKAILKELMSESPTYSRGIKPQFLSDTRPICTTIPFKPPPSIPWGLTWEQAEDVFESIEKWGVALGLVLFLVGIIVRLEGAEAPADVSAHRDEPPPPTPSVP